MANKQRRVSIHRLVVAMAAGRLLTRTEVVNHIDHDTSNYAKENLELWPTQRDHKNGEFGLILPGVCNALLPRTLTGSERIVESTERNKRLAQGSRSGAPDGRQELHSDP